MPDDRTVQLWELIRRYADMHSQRWSHLSSDDLASWAFLEVAGKGGGLKEWVDAALRDEADLEGVARLAVNRVAKRLQRTRDRAIPGGADSASGELAEMLNQLPVAVRVQTFRRISLFLSELPDEQLQLLTAYYVDHRPLAEIGQESGLTAAAVANRLLRIRKKIIRFVDEISEMA